MSPLHFCKRAKALVAAVIVSSTLAAVSGSAADASTQSSVPSFMDPTTLPICAKPGPQKPSPSPPKSIDDPTAYHCAVTPAVAGFQLKGVDNNKFLRLDPARQAQLKQDNGLTGPAVRQSAVCWPNCHNGNQEIAASGNRGGSLAGLVAQNPTLRADHQSVYNWIGLQTLDGQQLVQIGLVVHSWDGYCNVGGDAMGRPIIDLQWEADGNYSDIWCWPGYIFGIGSTTLFAVTTNGGCWWNVWVNWNNQWQALLGICVPNLTLGNAIGDIVPAEILTKNAGTPDPFIGTIHDTSLFLADNANWFVWNVPTRQFSAGPYCQSSHFSPNGSWSETRDC